MVNCLLNILLMIVAPGNYHIAKDKQNKITSNDNVSMCLSHLIFDSNNRIVKQ